MKRILGIDFGAKRSGLAVTDPLQIAVHPLHALPTSELLDYVSDYLKKEPVETIVFGDPVHIDGTPTALHQPMNKFIGKLKKQFPEINIAFQDEAYSSTHAKEIIMRSGASKKKRRDKHILDKISAVVILQLYLQHI